MSKAEGFAKDATQAGWKLVDKAVKGDSEVITIQHDGYGATMVMVWENGCYIYAKSSLVVQGHNRTVRNASEGRRFLAGVEAPKTVLPRKAKRRKALADPAPDGKVNGRVKANGAASAPAQDEATPIDAREILRRKRAKLPFRPSSPAEAVLKAVVGREIVWQSRLTGDILSASVLPNPDQKQLRIEFNRKQERILTFAARGEGFRSVYIESIVEVN